MSQRSWCLCDSQTVLMARCSAARRWYNRVGCASQRPTVPRSGNQGSATDQSVGSRGPLGTPKAVRVHSGMFLLQEKRPALTQGVTFCSSPDTETSLGGGGIDYWVVSGYSTDDGLTEVHQRRYTMTRRVCAAATVLLILALPLTAFGGG